MSPARPMILTYRHGREAQARVRWLPGEPIETAAQRAVRRIFGLGHYVQAVVYLGREESGFDAYVAHVLTDGTAKYTITARPA
jgi:hypothetical protein